MLQLEVHVGEIRVPAPAVPPERAQGGLIESGTVYLVNETMWDGSYACSGGVLYRVDGT